MRANNDTLRISSMNGKKFPSRPPTAACAASGTSAVNFFFELPNGHAERIQYVDAMQVWFDNWQEKHPAAAARYTENHKRAFQKLIDHTKEWLSYTDTEPLATEQTLVMFFNLLRERFLEYYNTVNGAP